MTVLDNDIKFLAGVGPRRAELLQKELGVSTFRELLYYFPFRYIDRTRFYRIGEVGESMTGSYVQLRARITGFAYQGEGRKKRFVANIADSTGAIELLWFQGVGWIEKRLEVGREYIVFGRPNFFKGSFNIVHPEMELVEKALQKPPSGLQGIYSTSERLTTAGLGTKGIGALVVNLWQAAGEQIAETLPEELMRRCNLVPLRTALHDIHFPPTAEALGKAEYRLKFEELFGVQLSILARKAGRTTMEHGFVFKRVGDCFNDFYNNRLPFALTGAQRRVVKEIRQDTVSGHQMNRLLQGDVGSGKTLVALMAMLLAADNGYQSCMMAPTEILARQHFDSVTKMLAGTPCEGRVAVLTGATRTKERRQILEALANGKTAILIGTHALLEDRVVFANLGMVVIDEQHRFGVEQRAKLWTKNSEPPHILVMTATPIPRTLAMTLYGDLDVSTIDELPPGRKPIETYHLYENDRLKLFGFMRREIAKGRQIYVVYPLIKESEAMDYLSLYEGFDAIIREFPLPEYRVGAIHGKMSSDDKNAAMQEFKQGVTQILVATSVIEVGVDVPNATVMIIESAERFGLSQLHQLRGRVGRGGEQSFCILMSGEHLSKDSRARLDAMVETNDGFRLSELDLKLRGAGDLEGTMQSGDAFGLQIASVAKDGNIIAYARQTAEAILSDDPLLTKPENRLLAALRQRYSKSSQSDYGMIS